MNFENPYYLLFLLTIPLYIALKCFKPSKEVLKKPNFPFPSLKLLQFDRTDTFAGVSVLLSNMFILGSIAALSVALARPRGGSSVAVEKNIGVDIVLVNDASGSMSFVDQVPSNVSRRGSRFFDVGGNLKNNSRLESAKRVMKNYIDKQDFNRIGLVLFGTYALTKSPLSSDKNLLKTLIDETQSFDEGATAIGTGLLTGLNRLKNSQAKSKVMILLTDGVNNAGIVDPITAANAARELGVRVYTIGIGNNQTILYPINPPENTVFELGSDAEFNPEILEQIAQITGGKYFFAKNENSLQDVYDEIDKLEKSEFSVKRRMLYEEKFDYWLKLSAVLLSLWILFNAIVIRIP